MIQLYDAKIFNCIAHFVGNKANDDGVIISSSELSIDGITQRTMCDFFFRSFIEKEDYYSFSHQSDVNMNTIYSYVKSIFNNPQNFIKESANIAKFLYDQTSHPKIKCGDLYVAYIKNCILDGFIVDAIGIFKSETKDTFLKLSHTNIGFNIESEIGTNIKKLDKGCIIFNKDSESGYILSAVDNTNKGYDSKYWIENFLHICQIKDMYSNTKNIMSLAKSFVTKELAKKGEVSQTVQIDLLNKSLQYFKEHKTFELANFAKEVISQPEFIELFHDFKNDYETSNDICIDREFQLSESAIKQQQRSYRRAINLDKKIQIIINGDSNCIEKGTDSRGQYYKIYYSSEELD